MKGLGWICIIVAGISIIVGTISRATLTPVGPMGLEARAFLQFSGVCLLAAINFLLLALLNKK